MNNSYTDTASERTLCFLCDYWWAILAFVLVTGLGYYFRDEWLPLVGVEPVPILGTGDIQVTLSWSSTNDIDLWVTDPAGESIYYRHPASLSGGRLDVDANANCFDVTRRPVENIFWPAGGAPLGRYSISVNYYQQCEPEALVDYHVRVMVDGQIQEFGGVLQSEAENQIITTIER